MIQKVISGGQTGADIAGLRAAKTAGISTGGFIPKGFKTHNGMEPWLGNEFNLVEIEGDSYAERTRLNVMQSDCTIRFAMDFFTPGERCTKNAIRRYVKPYRDYNVNELTVENTHDLVNWIQENKWRIINIAGNSEKRMRGMEEKVYRFLVPVFERVQFESDDAMEIHTYEGLTWHE